MKRKKSYMDSNNILSENWLKKLTQAFKSGAMRRKKKDIPKKVYDKLSNVNDAVDDYRKEYKKLFGHSPDITDFRLSDFEE